MKMSLSFRCESSSEPCRNELDVLYESTEVYYFLMIRAETNETHTAKWLQKKLNQCENLHVSQIKILLWLMQNQNIASQVLRECG